MKPNSLSGLKYSDYILTKEKIEAIFKLGIIKKYSTIIVGAFGCGAFRNPPDEVAKIFNEIIKIYGQYYENIIFSIIGDDNYNIFKNNINI